jgi:dethiobiotin synthetase
MTLTTPIAVCGIDTGIGKSIATGLLARHLLKRGKVVITQKLVQTGCSGRPEDILLHRKLMGADWHRLDEEQLTCPYTFPFAGSPHLAAELAGTEIDPAVLDRASQSLSGQVDQLIIEGAGGLLVPLTRSLLLLDYLAERSYPLILVTSPRLGSINHTLLCLEAIRNRNMLLLGLVYNLHGSHPREIVTDSLKILKQGLGRYGFAEKSVLLPDMNESCSTNWDVLLD